MNFFGHAWIAARTREDEAFVLGAMLPDLAPMAGLRIESVSERAVCEGRTHHIETDARFHACVAFREAQKRASIELQERGLRRGPARGVAHVGIELLLDGWLARRDGVLPAYRRALSAARTHAPSVRFRARRDAWPIVELCRKIAASPLPEAYANPLFTAERVDRTLSRRPRLALHATERPAVQQWAQQTVGDFHDTAERILTEILDPPAENLAARPSRRGAA